MEEGHKMQSTKEKGQKRKAKRTNNDPQNTSQETNDRETRTQLKARGDSCSGRVDNSCSISGAYRVTIKRQDYYMIFWI